MNLSVVIPAYNRLAELLTCLNSLRAYADAQPEIIVNDDHSNAYYAPAVILPIQASVYVNAQNVGFGMNCNTGATHAQGDVLFFVNQDVYGVDGWSQGWDTALKAAFDDPAVGIVGARLLFPNGAIQSAGGLLDVKGQPFHRCFGYSNPHYADVSTPREVTWVTGAALAIRKSLFFDLGGFDPMYERGYFEDADLCLRARAIGAKVWYEPRCTFIHTTGTSGGSPNFLRNAMMFRERWHGKLEPDEQVVRERFW